MADEPVTRPDLPMPAADYARVRRVDDLLAEATADDIPAEALELARHVYVNWHIGDPGDGRLHAALLVAARLIRDGERERIAALADECAAHCLNGPDGWRGPFADLIRAGAGGSSGNGQ